MSYYPEPHSHSRRKINVEFDLFNYAAKTGVKKSKKFDTWDFVKKFDLTSLQSEVGNLDLDQLKPVPIDLKNATTSLKKMLLKKLCMVNWLRKLILLIQTNKMLKYWRCWYKKIPDTNKFNVTHDFNWLK